MLTVRTTGAPLGPDGFGTVPIPYSVQVVPLSVPQYSAPDGAAGAAVDGSALAGGGL
jgi:hypothetical protein